MLCGIMAEMKRMKTKRIRIVSSESSLINLKYKISLIILWSMTLSQ